MKNLSKLMRNKEKKNTPKRNSLNRLARKTAPFVLGIGCSVGAYFIGFYDGSLNGFQEGSNKGYNIGIEEGIKTGLNSGYSLGIKEGENKGFDTGFKSGYDFGYDKGFEAGTSDSVVIPHFPNTQEDKEQKMEI